MTDAAAVSTPPPTDAAPALTARSLGRRFGDRWATTVVILVGTDANVSIEPTAGAVTPAPPDPFALPSPPPGAHPIDRPTSLPPPPPAP